MQTTALFRVCSESRPYMSVHTRKANPLYHALAFRVNARRPLKEKVTGAPGVVWQRLLRDGDKAADGLRVGFLAQNHENIKVLEEFKITQGAAGAGGRNRAARK